MRRRKDTKHTDEGVEADLSHSHTSDASLPVVRINRSLHDLNNNSSSSSSPSPAVLMQAPMQIAAAGGRAHVSHISLDTDQFRQPHIRAPSGMDVALQPFHYNFDPRQMNRVPPNTPQIVLQNSGAMVVYDNSARELVVYSSPPPNQPSAAAAAAAAASNAPSSLPVQATSLQVQHFNRNFNREDDMNERHAVPNFCRLCRRPFHSWDTYASRDDILDDDDMESPPFTSSNYFHLLAAATSSPSPTHVNGNGGASVEVAEEKLDEGASESRRSGRTRRRPGRSVEIVEEVPTTTTERKSSRSTRSPRSKAAASSSTPSASPATSTRAHTRSSSSSNASSPIVASPHDSPTVSNGRRATASRIADAEEEDAEDPDETLECGLKRSSFNSGYYARFFREECKLGAGGVGGVYLTHHVLDHVTLGTYAVKKIPVGNSRPWLLQVLKEVRALEGLHHRHIVAYKHSWLENFRPSDFGPEVPCLFLLMEYANRGTLAGMIWPKVKASDAAGGSHAAAVRRAASVPPPTILAEEDIWWIFIGTLLGLRHLHRAGVIHRDLKPENLLLSTEVDALGREHGLRVLVSDFGNAIVKGVPYARTGNTGTLAYSAPETLLPVQEFNARLAGATSAARSPSSPIAIAYDEKCDLWAVGVILYAMAFGKLPFHSNSPDALFSEIQQATFGHELQLPTSPSRPPEMLRMIRELLSLDPTRRPALDDLLRRPVITQRREARYAEQQIARRNAAAAAGASPAYVGPAVSAMAETYRPPRVENALVISPMLSAAAVPLQRSQRRARSVSPAPLTLAPRVLPLDDRNMNGQRSANLLHRQRARESVTSSTLSSISLVEEDPTLPPALSLVLTGMDHVYRFLEWSYHTCRGKRLPMSQQATACWRCEWNWSAEVSVHFAAFVLKLWLSLSLLLHRPSTASVYLHVFPQVFLTLALTITAAFFHPTQLPTISSSIVARHPWLSPLRRAEQWAIESSMKWHGLRLGAALFLFATSVFWIWESSDSVLSQLFEYGVNGFVFVCELVSIACSFYSSHASHRCFKQPAPVQTNGALVRGRSPQPTRILTHDDAVVTDAEFHAMQDASATPLQPPANVQRVPLLLPPTPIEKNDIEDVNVSRHSKRRMLK